MSITTEAREVLEKAQEDVFDIHGIYGLGDIRKALKYGKAALNVVDAAEEWEIWTNEMGLREIQRRVKKLRAALTRFQEVKP